MCPKAVIASSDAQASGEVVENSPDGSLELEWHPPRLNAAIDGNANNESDVEPVDMLPPIRLCYRCLCDVLFLGIIFLISVGL